MNRHISIKARNMPGSFAVPELQNIQDLGPAAAGLQTFPDGE